jgi:ATP synthase F1 gamma subunit
MRKLSKIREDVKFYQSFASLLETCKTIALFEFRSLEGKAGGFDKFPGVMEGFFRMIRSGNIRHPFVTPEGKPLCVIMVTSDGGMSGGLDTNIATAALAQIQSPNDRLIIVGRQGQNFARQKDLPFGSFPGIQDDKRFAQAMELRNHIIGEVLEGRIGPVKIAYARPLSLVSQRVEVIDLLPCLEQVALGDNKNEPAQAGVGMILESRPEDLIEYLVYLWLLRKLWEIFGMSRLAEVAARFMHAEDSTQRLKTINEKLRREYLRVRHEVVDQQMRELFAARSSSV